MPGEGQLDRLARVSERLRRAVLGAAGATTPAVRRDAWAGSTADTDTAQYLATVREHAYRVTDADVRALRDHGLSEDAIFELTVAAALGAAQRRLDAGLALLRPERRP